jgi:hypothetical protein
MFSCQADMWAGGKRVGRCRGGRCGVCEGDERDSASLIVNWALKHAGRYNHCSLALVLAQG